MTLPFSEPSPKPSPTIFERCLPFLRELFGSEYRIPAELQVNEYRMTDGVADHVECPLPNGIATHDFDQLTKLVLLAHQHRLRAEISIGLKALRGRLVVRLWDRSTVRGTMTPQHPGLDDLVKRIQDMRERAAQGAL